MRARKSSWRQVLFMTETESLLPENINDFCNKNLHERDMPKRTTNVG
jgi:hypothetical protein